MGRWNTEQLVAEQRVCWRAGNSTARQRRPKARHDRQVPIEKQGQAKELGVRHAGSSPNGAVKHAESAPRPKIRHGPSAWQRISWWKSALVTKYSTSNESAKHRRLLESAHGKQKQQPKSKPRTRWKQWVPWRPSRSRSAAVWWVFAKYVKVEFAIIKEESKG